MNKDYQTIIVGGGPAGLSTWLFLHQQSPDLAAKTLVIEKENYPRKKLCGGGISTPGRYLLSSLNFEFDFDHLPIKHLEITIEDKSYTVDAPPGFVVVDRAVFDKALATEAIRRGLVLHQGESFVGFERDKNSLVVETSKEKYFTKALVAADGANSKVRNCLNLNESHRICRLLETYAIQSTIDEENTDFETAYFDFSPTKKYGLQGYTWKFPCILQGKKSFNSGIFDSQIHTKKERTSIKNVLNARFDSESILFDKKVQSHPIRYFSKDATFSVNNILLVGDSVGIEPALGEGISTSIAYGKVAANSILEAHQSKNFTFSTYKSSLLSSRLGESLLKQVDWAKSFYANDENTLPSLKRYFLGIPFK
ncbi:MAG: NAD(P)/FAD-dependent oxidoreductase [Bacteroidia bacterium]|nr:NAD(P)/FAD-dependent oxidoreductase [Bacteroidia bacterium]